MQILAALRKQVNYFMIRGTATVATLLLLIASTANAAILLKCYVPDVLPQYSESLVYINSDKKVLYWHYESAASKYDPFTIDIDSPTMVQGADNSGSIGIDKTTGEYTYAFVAPKGSGESGFYATVINGKCVQSAISPD